MNREGIRRLAAEELGLPTSPYAFASSAEELAAAAQGVAGYPCFVKPVMSSSGKGQSYVETPDQIADAWRYALE
ncbi:MAG: ATP-grasp domain-containing protein, partial [Phenylobacterium sp.]